MEKLGGGSIGKTGRWVMGVQAPRRIKDKTIILVTTGEKKPRDGMLCAFVKIIITGELLVHYI
jgi:hypothetical protein